MKFVLGVLLALALITPTFAHAPKATIKATHRIEMHDSKMGDICSSTAIAPHALLTAEHCDLNADTVLIDGREARITQRIKDGYDHDIYIVDTIFNDIAQFAQHEQKLGDEVWIRGNPDGLPQIIRHGYFAGFLEGDLDGKPVVANLYNLDGWHGDSGAAVMDKHGRVVGVISVGFSDGSFGLSASFPLKFSRSQLNQAGVQVTD